MDLSGSRFIVMGLDPASGATIWKRAMPDQWRTPYLMTRNPRLTGPVLGLDDGRLVVAGVAHTESLEPEGLAVAVIDAASGETTGELLLPHKRFEDEFRLLRTPTTVVVESEGSVIALS